jgi:alpha-ribazole phosphatase
MLNEGSAASRGQAFTGRMDAATRSLIPSVNVTGLHLLRHGEVETLADRAVRGQMDVEVSEAGAAQHKALAAWLARVEPLPEAICSSDLARCRDLAERVAAQAGLRVRYDPRLREQHMGAWEGLTWQEISERDPEGVRAYWNEYASARPIGGESLQEVQDRVVSWWREVRDLPTGGRIMVVTHIGVIRVMLCHLLGLPLAEALRFAPATGSHTSLLLAEAGPVLASLGERPWL